MILRITAIGEILFDVYPEYKKLGGAPFNYIYHIWKLTGNGNFISRVGSDTEGKEIIRYLNERNFNTNYIQFDRKHKTGAVNVKLDKNKVPDFEIIENRAYDFIEKNDESIKLVENSGLFYIGSLAQRNEVSKDTIQKLAECAKKVFFDINIRQKFYTKEIINKSLRESSVVKLNSYELELVSDLLLTEKYDFNKTVDQLLNKYKLDLLCVTLGDKGAYLFNADEGTHYKADVKNIVDTVGAGDAYAAMMSIGYLRNWKIEKTNKLASEFAAEICKVKGAISGDETLYNIFREKINDE